MINAFLWYHKRIYQQPSKQPIFTQPGLGKKKKSFDSMIFFFRAEEKKVIPYARSFPNRNS